MVLSVTVGKNGKLAIGVSAPSTDVGMVQNADVPFDWKTRKIMYLQNTAKTTIMVLILISIAVIRA